MCFLTTSGYEQRFLPAVSPCHSITFLIFEKHLQKSYPLFFHYS